VLGEFISRPGAGTASTRNRCRIFALFPWCRPAIVRASRCVERCVSNAATARSPKNVLFSTFGSIVLQQNDTSL
jgi:hypothetical protein